MIDTHTLMIKRCRRSKTASCRSNDAGFLCFIHAFGGIALVAWIAYSSNYVKPFLINKFTMGSCPNVGVALPYI